MAKKIIFKTEKDLPSHAVSLANTLVNKTGAWRSMRPVIDKKKCISCMLCWKFCPDACIILKDKPEINIDYCKGCGICVEECPKHAVHFQEEKE